MLDFKEKYKNDLNFNLKQKIVEAIIFSSSEPIPIKTLAKTVMENKKNGGINFQVVAIINHKLTISLKDREAKVFK